MELLNYKKRKRCRRLSIFPCCICLGIIAYFFSIPQSCCLAASFKPDQIKAAFIYNLTNFITLPKAGHTKDTFIIGVIGNKDIAKNLRVITKGERIRGRPFYIKSIDSPADMIDCHVLFVDAQALIQPRLLKDLADRGILTIGDTDDFLKNGGIIGLLPRRHRIQIVINMQAARRAGISFNSKLLKVARVLWSQGHVEAGQW